MKPKTATNSLDAMRSAARVDRPRAVTPPPPSARPVRYSLLLDRELHKEIRRYALDRDVDVSAIVRVLFELLREDPEIGRRVASRLDVQG